MNSLFERDAPLRWHLRALAGVAGTLLAVYLLAVNLVFRIELR